MTSVSYPNGKSLTFTYNAGGRRTQMVDQSGYTVNYAYTPAGDLSQLTDGNNQPIVTYQYDAARRVQEQDNANGTFTTYRLRRRRSTFCTWSTMPQAARSTAGSTTRTICSAKRRAW